jgi:hypothetical protein
MAIRMTARMTVRVTVHMMDRCCDSAISERSRADGRTIAQSLDCRKFARAAADLADALARATDLSYVF